MQNAFSLIVIVLITSVACRENQNQGITIVKKADSPDSMILGIDVSSLTKTIPKGLVLFNQQNKAVEVFDFLRNQGINTIRLRLWTGNHPHYGIQAYDSIINLARKAGLNIWLDFHFSDTWADPANQRIPSGWDTSNFENLKSDFLAHISNAMLRFNPNFVQIGNEIEGGFLWPIGRINNGNRFFDFCSSASSFIRENHPKTKIIYHISNYKKADWFFSKLLNEGVDYDIGGVSYYPKWHGFNLDSLGQTLSRMSQATGKRMIIAENSYPFTLGWNDWTDNVLGWELDLHPNYSATEDGQHSFVKDMLQLVKSQPIASGYCYWEGLWVVPQGNEKSTEGTPWENQALFDFSLHPLPVWESFNIH
jgi:arabinogalactan endo-1,4-beta-galactosidase